MSATALQVVTVDIPNPEWTSDGTFHQLNSSDSFYYLRAIPIRTLSTNNANGGVDLQGLLYVPDLFPEDPCVNASAPYIPANVTRRANLPQSDDYLVAIAPWLSPTCVESYLNSAIADPAKAFLFYLPNNNTDAPPPSGSSTWTLPNNSKWQRSYPYPVYAIPGATGDTLVRASALYSGNLTDVPHGHLLSEYLDPRDYIRLYVQIDTASGSTLPSLWVFLLVVLGILLTIIGATSMTMHLLQRRRRQALRRRVANGEVDLEALGIKRLTVPQSILDSMPLYAYGSGTPVAPPSTAREQAATNNATADASKLSNPSSSRPSSPLPSTRPTPALVRSRSYHPTPLDQPTCAICLDDFVAASTSSETSGEATEGTIVRELPCHHIFHPECVDSFLRDSSSLCPMCKKTALPRGYCPRIVTNAMVRRERMVRRLRPDALEDDAEESASVGWSWRIRRWHDGHIGGRRAFTAPVDSSPASESMVEMTTPAPVATRSSTFTLARARRSVTDPASHPDSSPPVQPPSTPSRREWARQRAIAMLGRNRAPLDPEAEEAQRTTGWRKVVRSVFPWGGGG